MLEDKKIIVTGGSGFLGSHLVRLLIEEEGIPKEHIFVPRSKDYDLRDLQYVKKLFEDFPAQIVFHLAAKMGGIGANKKNPGSFFYENLIIGVQLMEQARLNNVEKFIHSGTVCSYPKTSPMPLNEKDLWSGFPEETSAAYGLAKKMLLVQSQAYMKQYNFNSINLLLANLYGPKDNFHPEDSHVIPSTIMKVERAIRQNQDKIEAWGSGKASREFLYVEDAVRGIILAAKNYNSPDPINLGSEMEITMKELTEKIACIMGYKGAIIWDVTKPEGQLKRCMDSSKIRELGFKATTSFDEGLRKTIEWYLNSKRQYQRIS